MNRCQRSNRILQAQRKSFLRRHHQLVLEIPYSGEHHIGSRRIDEFFDEAFFQTHFWRMWRTTFAFQKWHSAIELRRYFLRFVQEFSRIHTLAGVKRTKYNQYDSMVVPLQRWLMEQGVDVRFGHRVTDASFATQSDGTRRATALTRRPTSTRARRRCATTPPATKSRAVSTA